MPNLEQPKLLVAIFISGVALVVFAACGVSQDGAPGGPASKLAPDPSSVVTRASISDLRPTAAPEHEQRTEVATPEDESVSQLAAPVATVVPEPVATPTPTPELVAAPHTHTGARRGVHTHSQNGASPYGAAYSRTGASPYVGSYARAYTRANAGTCIAGHSG